MAQAKVLEAPQVAKATATINASSKFSLRDQTMLLLSHRAGLRAQEIAYLEVIDITDVEGRLDTVLHVSKKAAKYGVARDVPMDAELRRLLAGYLEEEGIHTGRLFKTQYGTPMTPNAVQKQIGRIYRKAGFIGASSHSGRRTFITKGSRLAGTVGCSLKDIQRLAGHADIRTTELYIELSDRHHDLVAAINGDGDMSAAAQALSDSLTDINTHREERTQRRSNARRDRQAVRGEFRQAV